MLVGAIAGLTSGCYQNLHHTPVQGGYGGEERCVTVCGRRQQEVGTVILESRLGEAGCAMGQ